jgi:CBS domain containing-hemolysin-like protein
MTLPQPQRAQDLAPRSVVRLPARAVGVLATLRQSFRGLLKTLFHPLVTAVVARLVRALSMDELRDMVLQARADGSLDARAATMLTSVLEFHDKRAHDVMRPRTEIVALSIDASESQVLEVVATERYSRYPVYQDTLDDVVGVFLVKDLLLHQHGAPFSLRRHAREALYVPGTRRAELVFDDLRRTRAHMAVVLDEYGGTAGIVTMEDLVEQVVGEIADEYDPATRTSLETDGVLELEGTLSLIDVRADHSLDIPEGDWTTLGGYVFAQLGRVPRIGDRVGFNDGELEVIAIDGRRVAAVRVLRSRGIERQSTSTETASSSSSPPSGRPGPPGPAAPPSSSGTPGSGGPPPPSPPKRAIAV